MLIAAAPAPPPTIGAGWRFHPGPVGVAIRRAGALRCRRPFAREAAAFHLELFARRRIVIVPAGIGVGRPRRAGPRVVSGRCRAPLSTLEPTGLVELASPRGLRLGDLFAIWGRRLGPRRLLSFGGAVETFVDGRSVTGDPRRVRLRPHLQVVVEVGGHVRPHRSYRFPPGR